MSTVGSIYQTWGPTAGAGSGFATNLNLVAGTSGADLVPGTYPIRAGANSFELWFRMYISGTTFNKVDNIMLWKSAGAYVTGEQINWNNRNAGTTAGSYAYTNAVATTSTIATSGCEVASGTAARVGIMGTNGGSITATGFSDFVVLQNTSTVSTPAGNANQKTFTITWDEQ